MKISDYRLAEYFIRKFCTINDCNFSNLNVDFSNIDFPLLKDNTILLPSNENFKITQNIFGIIYTYINNIEKINSLNPIPDSNKSNYLNFILSILRDLSSGKPSKDNISSLNIYPLIWIIIKDIISPCFNVGAKNFDIKILKTPFIDCVKYLDEKNNIAGIDSPVIIINSDINKKPYVLAFLLIESIVGIGLDPIHVLHTIISKKEIKDRFFGIIDLSFNEENEKDDFFSILSSLVDFKVSNIKKADLQTVEQTWWYIGLIEKLLEPARGSDWTIYEQMRDSSKELWDRVEDEKKKLGLNQLSFESLLRIQSEDYGNNLEKTMQGLLSDVRVW